MMKDAHGTESAIQTDSVVTYDDVLQAADRLSGIAHQTPVVTSTTLNQITGARVYLKCENFQRTGAFKFRGAYNALSQIDPNQKKRGVLTYSSGNHAQALALAGKLLSIPVIVVMPHDAPDIKVRATRGYGADIIFYEKSEITREKLARQISEERGLPIIPPYDHAHIVAGQGTVGHELFIECPELDVLIVCCGGGGLLSGCSISAKSMNPECRVYGVEPAAADDATRSFHTGEIQTVHNPDTIADGARTPYLGKVTFPIILENVDDMMTVSEKSILKAMFFLWERMKLVVEPTGALALSALLDKTIEVPDKNVGVVISGGNVDLQQAASLFAQLEA